MTYNSRGRGIRNDTVSIGDMEIPARILTEAVDHFEGHPQRTQVRVPLRPSLNAIAEEGAEAVSASVRNQELTFRRSGRDIQVQAPSGSWYTIHQLRDRPENSVTGQMEEHQNHFERMYREHMERMERRHRPMYVSTDYVAGTGLAQIADEMTVTDTGTSGWTTYSTLADGVDSSSGSLTTETFRRMVDTLSEPLIDEDNEEASRTAARLRNHRLLSKARKRKQGDDSDEVEPFPF